MSCGNIPRLIASPSWVTRPASMIRPTSLKSSRPSQVTHPRIFSKRNRKPFRSQPTIFRSQPETISHATPNLPHTLTKRFFTIPTAGVAPSLSQHKIFTNATDEDLRCSSQRPAEWPLPTSPDGRPDRLFQPDGGDAAAPARSPPFQYSHDPRRR